MPSIRPKPRKIRFDNTKPVIEPHAEYKCISCFNSFNTLMGSIRCRILRGYKQFVRGNWTLLNTPPSEGRPRPEYRNGRMCSACGKNYKLTDKAPTTIDQLQFLKDEDLPVIKRLTVTPADIELEDYLNEVVAEQDAQKHLPKVGNVNIPLQKNSVKSNQPPEPIHVNAFRRFMQSRGGGKKNYDREVNFDNQKRDTNSGDRRWFNRG